MLDTLIFLLQEESERICGKALPPEMCRKILLKSGGLRALSAIAFQTIKTINTDQLTVWFIVSQARLKAILRMKLNNGRLQKNAGTYTPRQYARDAELAKDKGQKLGDPRFWLTGWAVEEIRTHAVADNT